MGLFGVLFDLALAFVLPALLGHAALRALLSPSVRARAGVLLCAATTMPVGLGISSLLAFAVAAAGSKSLSITVLVESAAVVVLHWFAHQRARDAVPASPAAPARAPAPVWLRVAAALGIACAATSFVLQACAMPFGDADGIAIWGNRAVFMHRAFGDWGLVFSPQLVHTDYPLLVPASLARAWLYCNEFPPLAGVLLAAVFAASTLLALGAGVARGRDATLGAWATLALCATPFFAVQAAGQTGDVPLACYALLAAVWWRVAGGEGVLLAGLCASFCAWTKNEGLVIAGALALIACISTARATNLRAAYRVMLRWLAGGTCTWLALVAFKLFVAPRNDLFANHDPAHLLPMLTSGTRWSTVAHAFSDLALWFRGAGATTGFGWVMLAGLALLIGRAPGCRFTNGEVLAVALVLACDFLVFLLSPYDLAWHLSTALDRLLLQVWPLALFGVARALRSPFDARG